MNRRAANAPALPLSDHPHDALDGQGSDDVDQVSYRQAAPLSVASDLRRRRASATRCEPLEDGRRDPLSAAPDDEDRFTSARRLHVEVRGHTAWLYGGRVAWLLESANVPRQRDLRAPGVWTCPASRIDDVVTYAEHLERRYVTVERIEP